MIQKDTKKKKKKKRKVWCMVPAWASLLLLAETVDEEQSTVLVLVNPLSHCEMSSAVGIEHSQADIFLLWNMEVSVCLSVYVHPPKVNWRSTLTLPPQAWQRSSHGEKSSSSVSFSHSVLNSLSVLFLLILLHWLVACAQHTHRAIWCVYSALRWASGLALCARGIVGSGYRQKRK